MPYFNWASCLDPTVMLEGIRKSVSDRKLRLYFCARARQVARLLTDRRSLQAIDAAEQYADGLITPKQLSIFHAAACDAAQALTGLPVMNDRQIDEASAAWTAALCAGENITDDWTIGRKTVLIPPTVLCELLRDICLLNFSNTDAARWLRHVPRETGARKMALQIYETREFGEMPALGGILERTGCKSSEVLLHCRTPQIHAKGCWLLDSLLGFR